MSANKKTIFKGFDYLHCDDFARFLEEMAAKGWHFKGWNLGLQFEKGEPEEVTYAVEVFTGASELDMRPEPHTKEFAEYCEAAGWKFIDAQRKLCVFKKIQEDAIPILTSEERFHNVCKERRNELLPFLIMSGIMMVMQWFDMFNDLLFSTHIFSSFKLMLVLSWTAAFFVRFCKVIGVYLWKHKTKKKLAAGKELYLGNENGKVNILSNWNIWILLIVDIICFVGIPSQWRTEMLLISAGSLLAILIFAVILAKVRPESNTNFIMQTIFSMCYVFTIIIVALGLSEIEKQDRIQTEAPLLMEDYREDIGEVKEIILYSDSNILGSRKAYLIDHENDNLHYFIYSSENDWIMDRIWECETKMWRNGERIDCAEEWEAEAAFYDINQDYFVRYDNVILVFKDYENLKLTQEQIDIIRNKLDV